jgi:hypothetical protein
MLDTLCVIPSEGKCLLKCDCEGAEQAIFSHPASMDVIANIDYFAIELHAKGGSTLAAMDKFSETHFTDTESHRTVKENLPGEETVTEIKTRADFGALLKEKNMLDAAAEIGVAEGRYAGQILSWGIKKVYLVDLWEHVPGLPGCMPDLHHKANFEACQKLARECPDRVVILQGWSHERAQEVQDESLDLVHVDATHISEVEIEQVGAVGIEQDLAAWYPKLKPEGIMSGHDYLNPSYKIQPAVDQFAAGIGAKVKIADPGHINDACFWFEKPKGS